MREIKFRGKRVDNGEYIYGNLLTGNGEFAIIGNTLIAMVEPNSVAQLVGHDKNGNEVYEDDILLDNISTNEWRANLTWEVTDKDCDDIECLYNLDELTLKENQP